MIATGNQPKRRSIESWLTQAVIRACADDGLTPDPDAVTRSVREAIEAAMSDSAHQGGDRYFRLAYSELMARSDSAAGEAMGVLYRSAI